MGLIYLGIPKTASSSMRRILGVENKSNLNDLQKKYLKYKKFTIIREPLSRFTSAVYESFTRANDKAILDLKKIQSIKTVAEKYISVLETRGFIEIHTAPQLAYLKSNKSEMFKLDHILIFENLEEDFKKMVSTLKKRYSFTAYKESR